MPIVYADVERPIVKIRLNHIALDSMKYFSPHKSEILRPAIKLLLWTLFFSHPPEPMWPAPRPGKVVQKRLTEKREGIGLQSVIFPPAVFLVRHRSRPIPDAHQNRIVPIRVHPLQV